MLKSIIVLDLGTMNRSALSLVSLLDLIHDQRLVLGVQWSLELPLICFLAVDHAIVHWFVS